jgi:hypothetical protein
MGTKRRGGGKRLISVNFKGVEAGGGGRLLPEDTYQFELTEISEQEGQDSGQPYLAAVFQVAEGEYKGTKAWDNFSMQPQALWKFRSFLESAGYATEDDEMQIDPDELIGLVGTADVIHEDYRGKPKHRVNSWIIEQETPKSGRRSKNDDEDERPTRTGGGARRAGGNGRDKDEDETEWKVKDQVTFKDGKKTLSGRIKEIDGENVVVTVPKDGDYEMTVDDISAA